MAEAPYKLIKASDGATIELGDTTVVGRSADCGLVIKEELASRAHAILTIEAGSLWIENQSRNGTCVNGIRLTAKTKLSPNDRICFVAEEFVVFAAMPGSAGEDATLLRKVEDVRPRDAGDSRQVPRAWVAHSPSKTEFFDREQMIESAGAGNVVDQMAQVDVPTLVVLSGESSGARIELNKGARNSAEWTVGSDASQAIVLADPGVSALHATLISEGQRWQIVDKMSANGTFVDDKHTPKSYLSSGARIKFGPVECVFLLPKTIAGSAAQSPAVGNATGGRRAVVIGAISFLVTIGALVVFYVLAH